MDKKNLTVIPFLVLLGITCLFFSQFVLFGKIPFPGDLLISEYAPWKYQSYLGYNPGSYPSKAQYSDTIRQLIPWKLLSVSQIKQGTLPLWNPYSFSGYPLLANAQSGALYPLNAPFFLLSPSLAWGVYIFVQSLLAAVFTYLYARSIKVSKTSSIFSSIAFAFSLYMSVFLEYGNFGHTILWLPLILFSIEKFIATKKFLFGFLLSLGIALSGFAGHTQLFGGVIAVALAYGVMRFIIERKINWLLVLFVILGIGMTAVQMIPTGELVRASARVAHSSNNFINNLLMQPLELSTILSPDIYGNPATRNYMLHDSYPTNALYVGVISVILALFALFKIKKNNFLKIHFGIIAFMLILITNNPFTQFLFSIKFPFYASSSPSNLIFIISFCLAICAGIGLDTLSKVGIKNKMLVALSVGFIFAGIFLLHKVFDVPIVTKQFMLSIAFYAVSVVLVLFSTTKLAKLTAIGMILLLSFELFYFHNKFNPFVPKELFYPPTNIAKELSSQKDYSRYWGYGSANIEANFSSYIRTYSTDGYDPLYPLWYAKLISTSKTGASETGISNRSDAAIFQEAGELSLPQNQNRLKVLDTLSVKYILDRKENGTTQNTFPPGRFKRIKEVDGYVVYENLNALPRAQLVTREGKFEASIKYYSPMSYEVLTNAKNVGTLIVSDTFYPGWKATIDGKEADIKLVHIALRSVEGISPGKHIIRFSYQPFSFYLGAIVTIISILVLCGTSLYFKKNDKK